MGHEVQQTRWDRLVRRVSGSIGPGSRVSETLTELFPVFDVENVPAELLVLGGTRLCMGATDDPAIAGFVRGSMLKNPVGSNVIITVLQVTFFSEVAQRVIGGPTLNTYSGASLEAISDTRLFAPEQPVGQMLQNTLLVAAPDFLRFQVNGIDGFTLAPPKAIAVLGPNGALGFATTTTNTAFVCSYLWQERVAEPSELSL